MLILDLSYCGPSALLRVFYFFKIILHIAFIIIPIILIVMLFVDFTKAAMAPDDSKAKKITGIAIKRIIYAVVIFLVPTIVAIFNSVLGDLGVNYTACFNDFSLEAINKLAKEEEIIEKARKEAEKEDKLNKISKENEKLNIKKGITNNTISAPKAAGCDGVVYYENGIFYKPYSKYENGHSETKGSASYGYNKYFFDMLTKFVEAGKEAGHNIKYHTGDCAWRSFEQQEHYWNLYMSGKGNLAAVPGTSNHGWGIASDLKYGSNAAIKWAHANASKFNLAFPISSENWHIEPIIVEKDDSKVKKCM